MKRNTRHLLLSTTIILSLPLSIAYADNNPQNPWAPGYNPNLSKPNTQQYQPANQPPRQQYRPLSPSQARNPWSQSRQQTNRPTAYQTPPPNAHRHSRAAPPRNGSDNNRPSANRPAMNYPLANRFNPNRNAPDRPAAFNRPRYNPYNNYRGNRNNFWGRSGPNSWANPNKHNLRQDWGDMLNAPSRMGGMPGGWSAPSVSMPNPVDVGDQFQHNARNLPDQMRNMNGNN